MSRKRKHGISDDLLDQLLENYEHPEDLLGKEGILKTLQKRLLERVLDAELTHNLGYEKHEPKGNNSGNSRNGYTPKTLKGENGLLTVEIPRDRNGDFEPKIIPKNQTRFDGFDQKIISLYGRGMTTRDIQEQLKDLYGIDLSPGFISEITNSVIDEVKAWQSRPLDKIYPIVYLDALVIKVKQDHQVINKAFYLALGVNIEGEKELLGIWISKTEGAKFWLQVVTELKNRGVEDIFIASVDGLKGFPEAIETVFPKTQVQLCIVHQIRNSLRFVGWKNKKIVAKDLRAIYSADTLESAELALTAFAEKWDEDYPSISKSWLDKWQYLTPFFAYPPEIRKVIYTTNAIESLNMTLRKYIKQKRIFPSDEAALKQLYLALKNVSKKWTMPIQHWKAAMNRFMILFEDRLEGIL